jgi:hypothetical protein
MGRLSHTTG